MAPVATDIGLWVDGGILDISGTPKTAWNRTGSDPSWLPTDQLIVTPTTAGGLPVVAISPAAPVPTASSTTLFDGTADEMTSTYTAEVVNLTRNVHDRIGGGRAHIIFINCTSRND